MTQYIPTLEIADDCWTLAEHAVITALPNSASFLELMCADTVAEALTHVFVDDLEHPFDEEAYELCDASALAGFAIVSSTVESPYKITRGAAVRGFDSEGRIAILIEHAFTTRNRDDDDKTDRWFKRRIAKVMTDLIDYLFENGGLRIDSIEVVEGPVRTPEQEEDPLGTNSQATLIIEWSSVRPD